MAISQPTMPDIRKEHAIETYKAIITVGTEAVKTALLLNGGAAVAFLAFLGNLLQKSQPTPRLKVALIWYGIGGFLTAMSFVGGYAVNFQLYRETIFGTHKKHHWIVGIAVTFVTLSYICFLVGSVIAAKKLPKAPQLQRDELRRASPVPARAARPR